MMFFTQPGEEDDSDAEKWRRVLSAMRACPAAAAAAARRRGKRAGIPPPGPARSAAGEAEASAASLVAASASRMLCFRHSWQEATRSPASSGPVACVVFNVHSISPLALAMFKSSYLQDVNISTLFHSM